MPRKVKKPLATAVMADGIPVYCAFDEIASVKDLKPNPKNPNKHPDRQIELLAQIIKGSGWRLPITVSTRSGYMVRGHGRLLAATKKLGVSKVPVDWQDYESEAAERADLIADNRIPELADLDMLDVSALLKEMDVSHLALTGYDDAELARMLKAWTPDDTHLPRTLPNLGVEGEDTRTERFILVYLNEREKQQLMDLLGIDGSKVLYMASEIIGERTSSDDPKPPGGAT